MHQNNSRALLSLRSLIGNTTNRWLSGADGHVDLDTIVSGAHIISCDPELLRGRSVLLTVGSQLLAASALIELDGVARRIVLCPPGLSPTYLLDIIATAQIDALVTDMLPADDVLSAVPCCVTCSTGTLPTSLAISADQVTEWVLLTSGSTGAPKLVVHTLSSLTGAIRRTMSTGSPSTAPPVWSTFYDIRRYGGLQILLRALLGTGSMVLSSATETPSAFLKRAGALGATHISGTPSHWRRALMSPDAHAITPCYVRMSGEIADQLIINTLQSTYPGASVAHAFASTEAGLAFEVNDGLTGFPVAFVRQQKSSIELKVETNTLWIRSPYTADRYLGSIPPLKDAAGWIDTGDVVTRSGDRYIFLGRKSGVINVGGQKVYPEEIENELNRHTSVRASLVKARKNPITGAIVAADILLTPEAAAACPECQESLKQDILANCRRALDSYKVPAIIRFVATLDLTDSGKLRRPNA